MFKKYLTRKNIGSVMIIIWMLGSGGYIVHDQWQKFRGKLIKSAYQSGASNSIKTIINESSKCKPIPLFDGSKKVSIIAVDCLKKATE